MTLVHVALQYLLDIAFVGLFLLPCFASGNIEHLVERSVFPVRAEVILVFQGLGDLDHPAALCTLDGGIVEPDTFTIIPFNLLIENARLRGVHSAHGIALVATLESNNGYLGVGSPAVADTGRTQRHLERDLDSRASVIREEDAA